MSATSSPTGSNVPLTDDPGLVSATGRLDGGVRVRLILMMFLQYAIWGAWMPILSATLFNRGVPGESIGTIYGALWLACIITPFLGSQLVDRMMPSQVFLGISHLLAAGAAFVMAGQTTTNGYLIGLFVWSLLYAPSLGITNSIVFHQLNRAGLNEAGREKEFSWIRTAGSIGWIVAAFLLLAYTKMPGIDPSGKTGPLPEMQLTALLGVLMAIYSFTLPNTPPASKTSGQVSDPLAFRKALTLFKTVPGFTVFMLVSFIAATEFQFFYVLSGPFLESGVFTRISHEMVAPVKAISQAAEILALGVLLPLWLPKKGMRWCLLLGSFAWPLRYVIFAIGQPAWLVVASLALHGFGYAFVLVVQQLYMDRVSSDDIRASAQNLLNLVTLGIGNLLGSLFCGKVLAHYTTNGVTNWAPVFILPAVLTMACAIAYMVTFRDPDPVEAH